MLQKTLEQIGFSEKQARIYLACLELGETTIKEIAKKAEVKRTTIYDLIDEMIASGLIKQTIEGTRKKFIAASPEELQIMIHKREALLGQIMPTLSSMSNVERIRPKIRFYEGKESLIDLYENTLKYSGEILAFASEDAVKVLGMDWANQYIKKRTRKGLRYKGIISKSTLIEKEFTTKDQEQMRSTKIINGKKYPFYNEVMIYGFQKIAIVSAQDAIGVVIESSDIHNTQKSIFELLWDHLPEIKL